MKKLRVPVILLVAVLLFTLIPGGLADFGSFSGDSDFGAAACAMVQMPEVYWP